jgi:hypothetical protein
VAEGKLRIINTETCKITKDLGEITKIPQDKAGKSISRIKSAEKKEGIAGPAPITNGWIVNGEWTNNNRNPISYFNTSWIVPPNPATDNGQTIFLFNGIQQTNSGPFILQPVLQWGKSFAGGGSFWTITNWYVDGQGGVALHRDLIKVNPGDVVQGIMTLTGQSGTSFSYLSSFKGYPNADLLVTNIDELHWANITLECYDLKAFTDYPDTEFTEFDDIEIKIGNSEATLNWQADDRVTDNGQRCLIISNNSPGGKVRLYYRPSTGWHHNNLTHAASAPTAIGDPAGYTWDVDKTQHVVYRGNDGDIHELWFNA